MRVSSNYQVRNPATGEIVGQVQLASSEEIARAVVRARQAQHSWGELRFRDRAQIFRRFHDLMLERRDATLDTIKAETGKARRDALAEVVSVAGTTRYYLAHGAEHLQAQRRSPAVPALTAAEVIYKPHGVVGL